MFTLPSSPAASTGPIDFDALLVHFREVQKLHFNDRVKRSMLDTAESGSRDEASCSASAVAKSTPVKRVELDFVRTATADLNPAMATSTEFLIKVGHPEVDLCRAIKSTMSFFRCRAWRNSVSRLYHPGPRLMINETLPTPPTMCDFKFLVI